MLVIMILSFVILVLLIIIGVGALYFKNYKEVWDKRPNRYEQPMEFTRQSELKLEKHESEELKSVPSLPNSESQEYYSEEEPVQ